MKPAVLFVLLIFGVCLVKHVDAVGKICKKEEYTIVNSNGTFERCLACLTCHPGWGLEPKCGNSLQHPPIISCHACKPRTFSSEYDSSPCYACHQCAKYELITAHCSNKTDTVCRGKCIEGYYFSKTAPHNCQKCSTCCLDGKDEKIADCINQGVDKHCAARPDKDCGLSGPGATDASKGIGLTTTVISIIGVLVSAAIIVVVIIVLWIYRRKKKRSSLHNVEEQPSPQPDEPAEQRNGVVSSQAYVSEGPQAVVSTDTSQRVTFMLTNQNPTYEGTPRGSHKELAVNKPVPSPAVKDGDSLQKVAADSINPADEWQVKLPDKKDINRPPLCRQDSQDSQTSGDGEARFRKRSGSAISYEKLKRKLSERDDSLLEEESDDTHEPINITKHPKSQTAKEGSNVELKCGIEKKNKRLLYEWFKDGVAVIGQNEPSLVLEPVELRDFGRYMCRVSYQDSYGDSVESSPAKLDVTPQLRNGMRPKLLKDLHIDTKDDIATLLESKIYGLGGCRQVAAKYDMPDLEIEALKNSTAPGKDVLEFLGGSKPGLTVYSFCKTLKEDKIKRFDIVKKLEGHFLVRDGRMEYV